MYKAKNPRMTQDRIELIREESRLKELLEIESPNIPETYEILALLHKEKDRVDANVSQLKSRQQANGRKVVDSFRAFQPQIEAIEDDLKSIISEWR